MKLVEIPEISIITPVYNAESYLEECIESVLQQTFDNYEFILVNDGSLDNSLNICEKYSTIDTRIQVINQKNTGVSIARNVGILQSKAPYIMFLDADDKLMNNCIESMLNLAKQYEADIVCASYLLVKSFNRKVPYVYDNKEYNKNEFINDFTSIFRKIATAPWGKLFRRDIILDNNVLFPSGIPCGEDTIFNLQYYKYCKKVITTSEIIYQYNFCNLNSAVQKYYPEFIDYYKRIYEEYVEFFVYNNALNLFEKDIANIHSFFYTNVASHYLMSGISVEEKKLYLEKIKSIFIKAEDDNEWEYATYVKNNEWKNYLRFWRRKNMTTKLKIYINNKMFK